MTAEDRERILQRAMTRPDHPVVRRLTTGIVSLARQLGLNRFARLGDQRALTPAEEEEQSAAAVWLLDRRNSLAAIQQAASEGWQAFRANYLTGEADYRFTKLTSAVQTAAQSEIALSVEEMAAADFTVEPKPVTGAPGPQPPGK